MAAREKKTAAPPRPEYPRVIETYREPKWQLSHLESPEPTVFNGTVSIRRYRITAELLDEPVEVLRDRLKKLWRQSEQNQHSRGPMREVAKQLGMDPEELRFEDQGADYKKRTR